LSSPRRAETGQPESRSIDAICARTARSSSHPLLSVPDKTSNVPARPASSRRGATMSLVKRVLCVGSISLVPTLIVSGASTAQSIAQPRLGSRSALVVNQGALRFRDLNRNGVLDPYEDWRLAPETRARDLVRRMTLEEKAGAMMHGTVRSTGA